MTIQYVKAQKTPRAYGYVLGCGLGDHSGSRFAFWFLYRSGEGTQPFPRCSFHHTWHRCDLTGMTGEQRKKAVNKLSDIRHGRVHRSTKKVSALSQILG